MFDMQCMHIVGIVYEYLSFLYYACNKLVQYAVGAYWKASCVGIFNFYVSCENIQDYE